MGKGNKKNVMQNKENQVACSSSTPAQSVNQGNNMQGLQPTSGQQQQQPPFLQVTSGVAVRIGPPGPLQIGSNQLGAASGDFEQHTKTVLAQLDEWNATSLRELNASENDVMECITELKNRLTVLNTDAVVSSSDAEVENPMTAISNLKTEHATMIEKVLETLDQFWQRHAGIKHCTTLSRIGCSDIRKLINEFLCYQKTIQSNLEQRINELTDGEKQSRKNIEQLQTVVNNQQTLISTLTKELGDLKTKFNGTEIDQAQLVLRQLLTQVTTLMFKKLFPDKFLPKKTYTMSEIKSLLKKLKINAKSDAALIKAADEKQVEYDTLKKQLKWTDDMEDTIIDLKRSSDGNSIAHPTLDSAESVKTSLDVLRGQCIDDDEYNFSMQMLAMWEQLM